MILVDANLLLYAANRFAPEHERAQHWLDAHLNGSAAIGLPWSSLLAFVRIVTNPMVMRHPVSPAQAWGQVEAWLECEPCWIPRPGDQHRHILADFMKAAWMSSRLVTDAHLAALAIEHGLTLATTDSDFARFPGLKHENPLAAS